MTLRAVIFDIGDTLWKLDPLPPDLEKRMARELATRTGAAAELAGLVIADAMANARAQAADGSHREPHLASEVAAAAEIHHVRLADATAEAIASVLGQADIERFHPNPNVGIVFGELRSRGLGVGVLSNTWTEGHMLEAFLDAQGGLRHVVAAVYSSAEAIRKPHPEIYQRALGLLNVDAGAALFVGDRVREDVAGPQAVGMRAALTHEHRQEEPGEVRPDGLVRELREVLAVVEGLSSASGE